MNGEPFPAAVVGLLRTHSAFGGLPEDALLTLIDRNELRHFAPNETMLHQGEPSDFALFIVTGEVEILVQTAYGDVQVARGGPKLLVGEIGAFANLPRTATVRALTAVTALQIGREQLLELGRTNSQLLLFVIGQLGERLSRLNIAIGFYSNALNALESNDFDAKLLEDLLSPIPELVDFSHAFFRLAEQLTRKRQHLEEMANAAAIQRAMLPRAFKAENAFAAIDLYGELHSAREVGGDFYDYFAIDDRRLVLSIGDVSGKGIPASLFMGMVQLLIRLVLAEAPDLGEGLARINNRLAAKNEESMFATAFSAIIEADTGELIYSNCGHNPPLLLRRDGAIEKLLPTGPPLAAAQQRSFRTATLRLVPGDRLVCFSDGLPEATNRRGEFFGEQRVEQAVRDNAQAEVEELVKNVINSMTEFAEGAVPYDDVVCLGLLYRGVQRP